MNNNNSIKSNNAENRKNAISQALSQRAAVYSLIIEFNCETLREARHTSGPPLRNSALKL
jgi:hypothetical protein